MTRKEFDNTMFHKGMKIKLPDGRIEELIAIDFELMLFGIVENNEIAPIWYNANECELITIKS